MFVYGHKCQISKFKVDLVVDLLTTQPPFKTFIFHVVSHICIPAISFPWVPKPCHHKWKKRSHFTNKVHKQLLFLHYLCRTCRQPYCHYCQHINHEDPFWVNTSLKLHSNIINNHVFISYVHITLISFDSNKP